MRNIRHSRGTKYVYKPEVGVKTDFETLLQKFVATGTVRYDAFAKIWREMKMNLYCAGRQSQREAREYVEDCFRIAIQFCVPPSSFLVRAGAIYLLYGLFHFQLVTPKARIRLTPKYWEMLLAFIEEARGQQHLDLDYIFQSLVVDRAFLFTASIIWNYPSMKEAEDVTIISENLKENCNAVDEIFSSSGLNQLALIHDQYHKMKVVLNGEESKKPDTSLDIIHQDFINGIYKTLSAHRDKQVSIIQGVSYRKNKSDQEGGNDTTDGEEQMSHKKGLKRKAYKTFKANTEKEEKYVPQMITPMPESQKKKRTKMQNRGYANWFDIDDAESVTENTDFTKVLMNFPDEDAVVYKSTESSDMEREHVTDKGKAPVKGKAQKKGRKSKQNKNMHTDSEVDEDIKSGYSEVEKRPCKVEIDLRSDSDLNDTTSPTKRKRTSKGEMDSDGNTGVENDEICKGIATETESDMTEVFERAPKKKVKVKQEMSPEFDLASTEENRDLSFEGLKGKSKKKVTQKSKKKVISFKDREQTENSDSLVQGPTAQQKLHKKLADRAKQSRLSKQGKK